MKDDFEQEQMTNDRTLSDSEQSRSDEMMIVQESQEEEDNVQQSTRSGRTVRPPRRLDL